ncbi:LVIVD repeat-containing protein [Foetidibacter luteolus]|uniref:LVIVD repeat-containing protein n=1 Tax=Foetidibacter luteolus TaxID=2608880 RepID=UPI001A98FD30|nr:hypothetical protein [Foetidibacter luteolus]
MKRTTVFVPVLKTTAEVRDAIKSDVPEDVSQPGKIYLYGKYIFLNELGKGVHIIDNSNPAAPVNKAFIHIPGNEDIAVKGNILYADCFTDLMAIDISNPEAVKLQSFVHNIFPERQYIFGYDMGANNVVTKWEARDTVMEIEVADGQGIWRNGNFYSPYYYVTDNMMYLASSFNGAKSDAVTMPNGKGGSMARFALMNNYLYTVSWSKLNVVNVTNSSAPEWNKTVDLANWGIETIFPFKEKLFIGSQMGMYIYDVSNPEAPVKQGTFEHVRTCDPVIADDDYAYVTLHAGTRCGENFNQLDVVDIKNLDAPQHVKTYPLTNPHGLSKDGNLLFICDGEDGLKVFNASNVTSIQQLAKIDMAPTYDVICYNGIAIVSAKDGLYQYDYSNSSNIRLLSKIVLKQQ